MGLILTKIKRQRERPRARERERERQRVSRSESVGERRERREREGGGDGALDGGIFYKHRKDDHHAPRWMFLLKSCVLSHQPRFYNPGRILGVVG